MAPRKILGVGLSGWRGLIAPSTPRGLEDEHGQLESHGRRRLCADMGMVSGGLFWVGYLYHKGVIGIVSILIKVGNFITSKWV